MNVYCYIHHSLLGIITITIGHLCKYQKKDIIVQLIIIIIIIIINASI